MLVANQYKRAGSTELNDFLLSNDESTVFLKISYKVNDLL